ncbi:MAG: hypothetical protein MZV49_06840 [Rhodopseudomonas palustris]|nr:hypothetical protein [Rhodopseudomonas palustris]
MRQWLWLYPIVEIVHILGFVALVGAAVLFDLRLLGFARHLPVTGLARYHLRWARFALLIIAPSGLLMFAAHATEMAVNPAFQVKLALMVLAGLNAAVFHRGVFRSVGLWDRDIVAPGGARLAAILSLVLWTGVIGCSRLLAYL